MTHLSFEDFLDALCRCSVCKAWPTSDEIEAAGTGNAGAHLQQMKRETPEAYAELLKARAGAWGHEPLQHSTACIEHLCCFLIVACRTGHKGWDKLRMSFRSVEGGAQGDRSQAASRLEAREVSAFMRVKLA